MVIKAVIIVFSCSLHHINTVDLFCHNLGVIKTHTLHGSFAKIEPMKKLLLTLATILLITGCSSTPKQASADMTDINYDPSKTEDFESKHGCFLIKNTHAKNLIIFYNCLTNSEAFLWGFTLGLSKKQLKKIDNAAFIDVFNEFKKTKKYLNNCSATDLIKQENGYHQPVELIYECKDN